MIRGGFFVLARREAEAMPVASASFATRPGRKRPVEPTRPVFSNGLLPRRPFQEANEGGQILDPGLQLVGRLELKPQPHRAEGLRRELVADE